MTLHWDNNRGYEQTGPQDSTPPAVEGPRTVYGGVRGRRQKLVTCTCGAVPRRP
jgi:hypothetical protein